MLSVRRYLVALFAFAWMVSVSSLAGSVETTVSEESQPYYIGAYLYTNRFRVAAEEQGVDMFVLFDRAFKDLSAAGVNVVHVTIWDPEQFGSYVELARRHQIKLLPELDFAYFRLHWSDEEMASHAEMAIQFLRQWHDDPTVLAWSIKEEPATPDIERLDQYYRMIIAGEPEVKFFLVTSGAGWLAANAEDLPFALVGGDYYYFSWNQGPVDDIYARWPDFALSESRVTTAIYRGASAKFNVDRIHVFAVAACTVANRAEGFVDGSLLPASWSDSERHAYQEKVRSFAASGREGWSVFEDIPGAEGPRYNLWTLYMPPTNCTRAQIWSGIMEGAKMTLCFSYDPYSRHYNPASPRDAIENYPHLNEAFYADLAGRPGEANSHFEEFASTAKAVRRYDRILPQLHEADDSPLVTSNPQDDFYRSLPESSVTKSKATDGYLGDKVHSKAFELPGFDGRIIIVHNANVGTLLCPDCQEAGEESCRHVYIDDHGGLRYFSPQIESDTVYLNLKPDFRGEAVYDVATGQRLRRTSKGLAAEIEPGGAVVLYVGSPVEAKQIHGLYLPDAD